MKPPLVEFLCDPAHHAERPRSVELIETHISWVFLTERFAYKLKKPVCFEFLDFSTPARRERACWDELRLNRRLAPEVYLDVLPIAKRADGSLQWEGPGEPVDWVVKMRRLPADACLLQQLKQGAVSDRQIRSLADFLAEFYLQQAPLMLQPERVRGQLTELIHSNRTDLLRLLPDERPRIERLHSAQFKYVASHANLLDGRVCDGRYVDGHGDLRPEHIYLLPQPVVIDCIEFADNLRHLDILDELAFLSMECDMSGYAHVAEQIVRRYRELSGDRGPRSLLNFYKTYRACVRAKVHALRSAQESGQACAAARSRAIDYLTMAEREQTHHVPSRLIIVSGLMGTGKSSLAQGIAERLGATLLQTDAIRRGTFGAPAGAARYGEGIYQPERRDEIYGQLCREAERGLERGESVVLDGTFAAARHRRTARELAEQYGADFVIIRCHCPREVAIERIEHRRQSGPTMSDARAELFDRQAAEWETDLDALPPALVIDTRAPLDRQVEQVLGQIQADAHVRAGADD
jgi:aminoglycoside phosphotransferase family enzyme/predicted kinase